MAKKVSKAVNGVTPTARQKTNRFNMRIVMLELKQVYPLVNVGVVMDDETRKDLERTLLNCSERLAAIARHYSGPAKRPEGEEGAANA